MSAAEHTRMLLDAAKRVDEAINDFPRVKQVSDQAHRDWNEADIALRKAEARAHIEQKGEAGLAQEKKAMVELQVADRRYAAQLAEGLARSAFEALRFQREIIQARKAELSAAQSLVSLERSEAELARFASREVA